MARRRFFVHSVHNQLAELTGDDARHLSHVLRVEAGQKYEISDNRDVYLAEVETARKDRVVFRTLEKLPSIQPQAEINLYVALIKFDHLELIFEKATELGVANITTIESDRTEKGLEKAAEKRVARWARIVLESSQQSRRAHLPAIHPTTRFRDCLQAAETEKLLLDESRLGAHILSRPFHSSSVALLIGPEGGWTESERKSASDANWTPVSLGPQILRTETAAIAALAIISAIANQSIASN